ncbi:MAG TPA: DUF3311 domain-containing protein [Gammaproteobacteria bacterium]|nr:DUF3311 domain-containing protein [Gammaproteobacteria bacterium]
MNPERHAGPFAKTLIAILFLGCCAIALAVPLYNRARPALFGVPFFYWFQFLWIIVTGAATALAYRLRI